MPPLFWLKQAVKLVALPPLAPLLLAIAGLAVIRRHPTTGRRLGILGIVTLWLLATPAVSDLLQRCLDRTPPLVLADATPAQAIVILGGGTRRFAAEYGGATISGIT